jgi:hypothetical protein
MSQKDGIAAMGYNPNGDDGRHAVPVVLETALVTAGVP